VIKSGLLKSLFKLNPAAALSDYGKSLGFKVTQGVGEIPTAFSRAMGVIKPIIKIMVSLMPYQTFHK
jgi:hypothetical protein